MPYVVSELAKITFGMPSFTRGIEHVVGAERVDPERLVVGPDRIAGIAAKWTTASYARDAGSRFEFVEAPYTPTAR